jgi:hypothetical protein
VEGAGFEPSVPPARVSSVVTRGPSEDIAGRNFGCRSERLDIYRTERDAAPVFVFVRDHHWPCDYGFPADVMACGISVRLGA